MFVFFGIIFLHDTTKVNHPFSFGQQVHDSGGGKVGGADLILVQLFLNIENKTSSFTK